MKRLPLYRPPLAGLMSLAILATSVPQTALADQPPQTHRPDDNDRHDVADKEHQRQQANMRLDAPNVVLREENVERHDGRAAAEAPAVTTVPAAECRATAPAARRACERAQRL